MSTKKFAENLFGWMTSISYQADLNRSLDSWKKLVDETCEYGLNYLCISPESEGSHESRSWDLDWPTPDPEFNKYRNKANRNSSEETEYLSQVLDYAREADVQVDLFLWMYVWPQVMQKEERFQSEIFINREKKKAGHCWDNPELLSLVCPISAAEVKRRQDIEIRPNPQRTLRSKSTGLWNSKRPILSVVTFAGQCTSMRLVVFTTIGYRLKIVRLYLRGAKVGTGF
jgi:hypothetical protein